MNVDTLGICCPLRRGGALSGKAPDGARTWDRGNKSRCRVLMAGFSWRRGDAMQCAIAVTDRIFLKGVTIANFFCLHLGTVVRRL